MPTQGGHAFNSTGRDLSQTSSRRRSSAAPEAEQRPGERRQPRRGRPRRSIEGVWWRTLALLLAGAEVLLLGWALQGDATAVHQVTVTGLAHLSRDQVIQATGLTRRTSVLAVDGESIRRGLERLSWVRTASVQPLLPDRVAISIDEWVPVAVYRNGPAGKPVYLNDQGRALALASAPGPLPLIQGGGSSDPKVGSRPLDAQLLAALVRVQAAFPAVYGQSVSFFQLDCVGSLSLVTGKGVTIYFGRVLTQEEFASLSAKLSALKSIAAADPEVANPARVEYINLEDEQQPAVKFKGDKPSPAPPASPRPSPGTVAPSPALPVAPCR
jgi:cell division septal protein FtsQ